MRRFVTLGVALILAAAAVPLLDAAGTRREQVVVPKAKGIIWSFDAAMDPGSGQFLVVWLKDDGILGRFYELNTTTHRLDALGGEFYVSRGLKHQPVRTEFGDGKFLVTYAIPRGADAAVSREFRMVSYDDVGDVAIVQPPAAQPGTVLANDAQRTAAAVRFIENDASPTRGGHFLVAWPKDKHTWAQVVFSDGTTIANPPVKVSNNSGCPMILPEMAIDPVSGQALIVGWKDGTADGCTGQGGLWFKHMDESGSTDGAGGLVVDAREEPGLHWQHGVAYGNGRYQVGWSRKGKHGKGIWGRGLDATGTVDAVGPIQEGIGGGQVWDNNFGEIGIAFDPRSETFLLGARGEDSGDGRGAVVQIEVNGAGDTIGGSLKKMTETMAPSPDPVMISKGDGYMVSVFRDGWFAVNAVVFEPGGGPPPTDGPNLLVPALTVPATAKQGETVSVSVTTRNNGGEATNAASVTGFYLSRNETWEPEDRRIGEINVSLLGPGVSEPTTFDLTLPDASVIRPGAWFLIARADDGDTENETNEGDNTVARPFTIPGFDLTIVPGTFMAPTKLAPGAAMPIRATVRNAGPDPAPPTVIRLFLSKLGTCGDPDDDPDDDVLLGEHATPQLNAATSDAWTETLALPNDTLAGRYTLCAVTDATKLAFERNEKNNTKRRLLTVIIVP